MKAAVIDRYGGPDVLTIVEVDKPSPKANEVCVKIIASSINSADYDLLSGTTFGRFSGPFKPRYHILGSDIAGVVVSIGINVSRFKVGDAVYGDMSEEQFGAFCEYKCVDEKALYLKPDNMSFNDAAALPSAGVIALQGLTNMKQLEAHEHLLLNGAGGGMGTYALMVALHWGAKVTAVDSTYKQDKILALGATAVIDYKKHDYIKNEISYDRILDCQSVHTAFKYPKKLKENGIYYMVGGKVSSLLSVALLGPILSKGKHIKILLGRFNNAKEMNTIEELYKDGIKPIIDKVYSLDDISKAFEHFMSGNFFGKIVIRIMDEE